MVEKKTVCQIVDEWLDGKEYFLVEVAISPDDKIVVEIDHKEGVWIEDCVELSRYIESKLNREDEDYELEVGSAGIGQPFKVLQQYTNHIGKEVEVLRKDGRKLCGVLKAADEQHFTVTVEKKVKPEGDLTQFVHRSLDSFRPLMKKKDIQFQISCSPDPFNAYFDPDKLDKILYNLLSNASKYNRAGGLVSVELSENEDRTARLVVKDNGPGISAEAQKNLFKRFYEGDYRKFKTIGTGIGLSLVRDLVVLHHGTITVESEEGKGTLFIVNFPVLRNSYAEEEIEESLPADAEEAKKELLSDEFGENVSDDDSEEQSEPTAIRSSYSLLIVEDNEELLQLMTKLLGADYMVYTANNGKEAIDVVEQEEIDLIVSDVMMPEMDGIEFCQYIKNKFETSHIPVVLLTAKNKEEDRVEAYESGADGFISKPFNLSVLHARISNLLRSRERMGKDFKKQLVFEAKELNYTSVDEDFLQRAIDCVHRHLDDPDFDQAKLLEEMYMAKSTFFRKLKSLTGLTYVSFIRNIRMKAACRIMEEKKNIRISELAYAVGYNDPRYFSKCFKAQVGMTPTEYRDRVGR